MTKRITAAAGAIAAMLTLTACGAEDWDGTHENHLTPRVITVDGRDVTCVIYKSGYGGGVSCDWEAIP